MPSFCAGFVHAPSQMIGIVQRKVAATGDETVTDCRFPHGTAVKVLSCGRWTAPSKEENMTTDRDRPGPVRPSRKIIWIVGGLLLAIIAIVSLQGIVRGSGEAMNVTAIAPGDDNAAPAPETIRNQGQ